MDIILGILALIGLCLFFCAHRAVNGAAAPLLAVCTIMVAMGLGGALGLLQAAGWAVYLAGFGLAGLAVWKKGKALFKKLCCPGFWLFVGFSAALFFWLWYKQPVFSEWDEFTFAGFAAKKTVLTDAMYSTQESGNLWTTPERPALVMLAYFFQFFAADFSPWKMYWAYDVLLLACAAAALMPFGAQRWRVAVPLFAGVAALPFAVGLLYHTVFLAKPYLSVYSDIPMGMLMGAVLALYFGLRSINKGGAGLCVLPLAALVLVKENYFSLSLVAAGILAADGLLFGHGWAQKGLKDVREELGQSQSTGWAAWGEKVRCSLARVPLPARKIAAVLGWFLVPLVTNRIWQRYPAQAAAGLPQTNTTSLAAAVWEGLASLLGLQPLSEKATLVINEMFNTFLGRMPLEGGWQYGTSPMSALGSGLVTLAVCIGLFVLAVCLAPNKRLCLRTALAGGLLLAGFGAYQFQLYVVYAFYSRDERVAVFDYARYLSAYFTLWLLLGLFFVALAAIQKSKKGALGRTAVALLAAVLMLRVGALARTGYTVLDMPSSAFDEQRANTAEVQAVLKSIPPDARIFFVQQGGDGRAWLDYAYELLPRALDYSIKAGGTFVFNVNGEAEVPLQGDAAGKLYLKDYLQQREIDTILVLAVDENFVREYGPLFAGNLGDYASGDTAVYRLQQDGLYHRA